MVKLFKYPSVTDKSEFKAYRGHSSHVTRVRFSFDDKYLVSIGGNDKTIIIWNTDLN
jgi:microtubule-associated protein-like 6